MISEKRLTQIEAALTPKQAVLLWLRDDHRGRTTREYVQRIIQRPASASPRSRVGRQVAAAVQTAMKGQDPVRVQQAARQARMETDFLILLVNRTNCVVCNRTSSEALRVESIFLRLSIAGRQGEDVSDDVDADLREAAAELFSLQLAVKRIEAQYFSGECILAEDVKERLDFQAMFLRCFLRGVDRELEESGDPLVIGSDDFWNVVDSWASKKVLYVCALAKSAMLQDYSRGDEANALLKPYVLGSQ
jgi:hypothetical protein